MVFSALHGVDSNDSNGKDHARVESRGAAPSQDAHHRGIRPSVLPFEDCFLTAAAFKVLNIGLQAIRVVTVSELDVPKTAVNDFHRAAVAKTARVLLGDWRTPYDSLKSTRIDNDADPECAKSSGSVPKNPLLYVCARGNDRCRDVQSSGLERTISRQRVQTQDSFNKGYGTIDGMSLYRFVGSWHSWNILTNSSAAKR